MSLEEGRRDPALPLLTCTVLVLDMEEGACCYTTPRTPQRMWTSDSGVTHLGRGGPRRDTDLAARPLCPQGLSESCLLGGAVAHKAGTPGKQLPSKARPTLPRPATHQDPSLPGFWILKSKQTNRSPEPAQLTALGVPLCHPAAGSGKLAREPQHLVPWRPAHFSPARVFF